MNSIKSYKIKQWLDYSNDDLIAAVHFYESMEFPIYRVVCYNAQQSAEKFLKAYQIYFDMEIIKTHDLSRLVKSLLGFDEELAQFLESLKNLSNHAVKYRYPDDFEDLTKEDAQESLNIAKQIQQFILSKIVL